MSHPEHRVQVYEVNFDDPKEIENWQETYDKLCDRNWEYAEQLGKDLGLNQSQAADISYLRGRSRWTEELENRIITAMKDGYDITCYRCDEEEQLSKLGY